MNRNDIIYEDFCNLDEKKFIEKLSDFNRVIINTSEPVLISLNFKETFLSSIIILELRSFFTSNSKKIKAAAFLGIGYGVRKLILQSINCPIFITEDSADSEDWLLDQ